MADSNAELVLKNMRFNPGAVYTHKCVIDQATLHQALGGEIIILPPTRLAAPISLVIKVEEIWVIDDIWESGLFMNEHRLLCSLDDPIGKPDGMRFKGRLLSLPGAPAGIPAAIDRPVIGFVQFTWHEPFGTVKGYTTGGVDIQFTDVVPISQVPHVEQITDLCDALSQTM